MTMTMYGILRGIVAAFLLAVRVDAAHDLVEGQLVVAGDVPHPRPVQQVVALLHLVHGPGQDRLGLLLVLDDRVIRCGICAYSVSSTFFGSIRIIWHSSGRRVSSRLRMIVLRHTDLPVPVRPAIEQVRHRRAGRRPAAGPRCPCRGRAAAWTWRPSASWRSRRRVP